MSTTLIDEAKLKEALKSAIVEIPRSGKTSCAKCLKKRLKISPLARAIEEGEQSELVTRDEVFKALESSNN